MSKLILLILLFSLTGCFENSGNLSNKCVKNEKNNNLSSTITYQINFKKDIINNLTITYDYSADQITIDAIKNSYKSQNNFIGVDFIEEESDNKYKITYSNIDLSKDYSYFIVREKRSELVSLLEKEGFECKND